MNEKHLFLTPKERGKLWRYGKHRSIGDSVKLMMAGVRQPGNANIPQEVRSFNVPLQCGRHTYESIMGSKQAYAINYESPLSFYTWLPEVGEYTNAKISGAMRSLGIEYIRVINGWARWGRRVRPTYDGVLIECTSVHKVKAYLKKKWS